MSGRVDETDEAADVEEAMRGRLNDVKALESIANGDLGDVSAEEIIDSLGIGNPAEYAPQELRDMASDLLSEMPLCVDTTTVFEVVLGSGGPDDRLIVECDTTSEFNADAPPAYEIRRILYSWDGSAERILGCEDYDVAEQFARRVVPELVE